MDAQYAVVGTNPEYVPIVVGPFANRAGATRARDRVVDRGWEANVVVFHQVRDIPPVKHE